jgi:hypothetical protein
MKYYRCKVHTGPGKARHFKRIFSRARLRVVATGTESLRVDVKAQDEIDAVLEIQRKLIAKHRTDFMPGGAYVGRHIHCWRRSEHG